MVQHKPTPEEQLLKLIENPETPPQKEAGKSAGPAVATKKKGTGFPSFGKLVGFLSYFKTGFKKKTQEGNTPPFRLALQIKWLNHILIAMVVAAAAYLALDLFVFQPDQVQGLTEVSVSDPVYPVRDTAQKASARGLSFYQETATKRNPFLPPQVQPQGETIDTVLPAVPSAQSDAMAEILQSSKLVGISLGEEPLAMIEDITSGRTYFLREGQDVRGMKVQKISQEKVTVTFEGEEGELF